MSTTTATPTTVTVGNAEVKVGDFLVSSWGYDQTNVDFYKVVGFTKSGKSVRLQKWSSQTVDTSSCGSSDRVVPGPVPAIYTDWSAVTDDMDHWQQMAAKVVRDAPVFTKRLSASGYFGASVSLTSYSNAYLWDGKPEHQTGYGFGH